MVNISNTELQSDIAKLITNQANLAHVYEGVSDIHTSGAHPQTLQGMLGSMNGTHFVQGDLKNNGDARLNIVGRNLDGTLEATISVMDGKEVKTKQVRVKDPHQGLVNKYRDMLSLPYSERDSYDPKVKEQTNYLMTTGISDMNGNMIDVAPLKATKNGVYLLKLQAENKLSNNSDYILDDGSIVLDSSLKANDKGDITGLVQRGKTTHKLLIHSKAEDGLTFMNENDLLMNQNTRNKEEQKRRYDSDRIDDTN